MWKSTRPTPSRAVVFDYRTLRLIIGLIAIVLPVALPIGAGDVSFDEFLTSMSAYYHDETRDLFVGCLCAIAMFLFAYHGKAPLDMRVSKLACLFALGVAFFPTTPETPTASEKAIGVLHYVSAGGLFGILALFCLVLFPNTRFKEQENLTVREKRRDLVYLVCGSAIVLCIALILLTIATSEEFKQQYKPVFFLEWIALTAFGISWFTAGKYWRLKFLVDEKDGYHIRQLI